MCDRSILVSRRCINDLNEIFEPLTGVESLQSPHGTLQPHRLTYDTNGVA